MHRSMCSCRASALPSAETKEFMILIGRRESYDAISLRFFVPAGSYGLLSFAPEERKKEDISYPSNPEKKGMASEAIGVQLGG